MGCPIIIFPRLIIGLLDFFLDRVSMDTPTLHINPPLRYLQMQNVNIVNVSKTLLETLNACLLYTSDAADE